MRTIIDIPYDDERVLRQIAEKRKKSRAAVVREAIAEYLSRRAPAEENGAIGFGAWKGSDLAEDGLAYERRLRSDWE